MHSLILCAKRTSIFGGLMGSVWTDALPLTTSWMIWGGHECDFGKIRPNGGSRNIGAASPIIWRFYNAITMLKCVCCFCSCNPVINSQGIGLFGSQVTKHSSDAPSRYFTQTVCTLHTFPWWMADECQIICVSPNIEGASSRNIKFLQGSHLQLWL